MPGGEVLSPVGKRDHLLVVELLLMAFVKGEPKSELFKAASVLETTDSFHRVPRWESASPRAIWISAICRASWGLVDGQGRLGLMRAWSPRLTSGSVRPVESAVKPSRRHTKTRRGWLGTAGLGTTTARG